MQDTNKSAFEKYKQFLTKSFEVLIYGPKTRLTSNSGRMETFKMADDAGFRSWLRGGGGGWGKRGGYETNY